MNEKHRCAICDEWYDPRRFDQAKVHEHPEPQSGQPRIAWLNSGLSYERWITETLDGKNWVRVGEPCRL